MTCRPCLAVRRRPWLALLAVVAGYGCAAHLDWADHRAAEARAYAACETDTDCAQTPACLADPTCDGGPYPHPTTTQEQP